MKLPGKKAIAVTAIAVAFSGGWLLFGRAADGGTGKRYKLQTIEAGTLTRSVSANGTLNPVTLVNVGTQVSGTVKTLHADFNDKVRQGQTLAQLDDTVLSAQARQSAAGLRSAEANLDLAVANETRLASLSAKNYISGQMLDQAVQARRAAAAAVDLARAQADKDRANLSYTVIRSPVAGVVIARSIDVGQTVAASFQTPTLFQIAQDLAKMQIDTSFPEADIGSIQVGMRAQFSVDTYPGRSFEGLVKQIRLNPTTQQNVVTYNVVIAVDNPDQALLPGMTAYVNIGVATRNQAILVPNAALRFKPDDAPRTGPKGGDGKARKKKDAESGTVYVLRDEHILPLALTLGITDNRSTELLQGDLKAGDQVIVGDAQAAATTKARSVGMRMF